MVADAAATSNTMASQIANLSGLAPNLDRGPMASFNACAAGD